MSTQEMVSKVRELRELQALVNEAEQEMEAIKDSIKAVMCDTDELNLGEYKITWKPVETARIDTAALKKALPDVVSAFTRTTTSKRFVIA